jgi:hypothetical protein
MYKNIVVLDKEKFKSLKYDEINFVEIGKNIGLVPVGFTEVWNASHNCPIIINAGEDAEFLAFTGITKEVTIFNKEDVYIPAFIRTYPFLNLDIKDKEGKNNYVIGIDNNPDYVAKNKKNSIFDKNKELTKESEAKINLVKELNRQRDVSKKNVKELKEYDLLVKKDLRVNLGKEEKVILDEFYVIDIDKLVKLDDKIISTWARKGWMGIFDAHLKSIVNFDKILKSN